jgi:membrane protein implicated in regulation of membrane protease activity
MNYDFIRYLGESLGGRVSGGLVYLFLAYQLVVSALVFLFDSGFPAWLVIAGWIAFMLLLAVQAVRARKKEKREAEQLREEERQRRQGNSGPRTG